MYILYSFVGTILTSLLWDGIDYLEKEDRVSQIDITSQYSNESIFSAPFIVPIQILKFLLYGIFYDDNASLSIKGSDWKSWYINRRYCSFRVGKIYTRLLIDLEHCGCFEESLHECNKALQDVSVQVSRI
jgi:hypothetical protein